MDNFNQYYNLNFEYNYEYKFLLEIENDPVIYIFLDEVEHKNVLYSKKIDMNQNMLKSLSYQLCFERKQDWNEIYNKINNYKSFYFSFVNNNHKINNFIFQTKTYEETLIISRAILNENSIQFMREQLFERFILFKYPTLFINYRNHINSNFEPIDRHKFLIFSSTIFWSYGIRENNDLDCYISHNPLITKTKNFLNKIDFGEKYDIVWIGLFNWNIFSEYLLKVLCQEYKISSFNELIFNPKYHYYFCGMKMTLLNFEVIRRQFRQRASSIADLIAIKMLLRPNLNYYSESINFYKKLLDETYIVKYENKNIIHTIQNNLKYRHNIILDKNIIFNIVNQIKYNK